MSRIRIVLGAAAAAGIAGTALANSDTQPRVEQTLSHAVDLTQTVCSSCT